MRNIFTFPSILTKFLFVLLLIAVLSFRTADPLFDFNTSSIAFQHDIETHKSHHQVNQETRHIYYGFWDHKSGFDFINVGKSKSKTIDSIVEEAIPGIAIIEGFSEKREQIRRRLKDNRSFIIKYRPSEENLFTILTDEPFSEGKNAQIMEQMIADAKEIIGKDYAFAFTFKELAFLDDRKLPKNMDWVGINFYPFRVNNGVQNKRQFMNRFEYVYQRAKAKVPNARIFIVGQAFHGGKWIQPPHEAPFWYMEFVQSHDIDALLWWKLRSSSTWKGAEDIPEMMESIREVGYRIKDR